MKGSRVVDGERHVFFYNPMWEVLGRNDDRPPGTFYYNRGGYLVPYWHAFDQVLVRPDLLCRFPMSGVSVIEEAGDSRLLDARGLPNSDRFSDHLPILFCIEDNK